MSISSLISISIFAILISNFALYIVFSEFIQSDYFISVTNMLELNCGIWSCDRVKRLLLIFTVFSNLILNKNLQKENEKVAKIRRNVKQTSFAAAIASSMLFVYFYVRILLLL